MNDNDQPVHMIEKVAHDEVPDAQKQELLQMTEHVRDNAERYASMIIARQAEALDKGDDSHVHAIHQIKQLFDALGFDGLDRMAVLSGALANYIANTTEDADARIRRMALANSAAYVALSLLSLNEAFERDHPDKEDQDREMQKLLDEIEANKAQAASTETRH